MCAWFGQGAGFRSAKLASTQYIALGGRRTSEFTRQCKRATSKPQETRLLSIHSERASSEHPRGRRARLQRGDPTGGPRRQAPHEPGRRRAAGAPRVQAPPRGVGRHAVAARPPPPLGISKTHQTYFFASSYSTSTRHTLLLRRRRRRRDASLVYYFFTRGEDI